MTEKLSQHIHTAAANTLEALAFLEVFPATAPIKYTAPDIMQVHLRILEPYDGFLGIKTSKTFITNVAADLFSLSAREMSPHQLTDLLNELLNTMAGSFLATALPADQQFKIGLPSPGGINDSMDSLNMCVWDFETDAGNFTLYGTGEMIEQL